MDVATQVIDDLKDECDRHAPGGVVAVKVPRPPAEVRAATEDFMGIGNYGKVSAREEGWVSDGAEEL